MARAGVGVAALLGAVEVASELRALTDPALLRLPRLDALPELGPQAVGPFLGVWILAALAFTAGWRTRTAGITLTGFLIYVMLLDQQLYSNHLYLMTLLVPLLTLAGSDASFSVRALRKGRQDTVAAWPVLLIRLLVTIVYGYAVLAKLNLIYLSGLVLKFNLQIPGLDSLPPMTFAGLAFASLATELFLALAFWSPRLRPLALVAGVGFHLTILITMQILPDLLTFLILMVSAYLAFWSALSKIPEPGLPDPLAAGA